MRSKKPIAKKRWSSILIDMEVINKKKQNLKNSMRLIPYFLMIRKKLTMTVMELWIIMDREDLVDLDEDFRGDLMPQILVIFSHHFLDEECRRVDLEKRQISVRISRSDSGSLSRMRSEVRPEVSSSIVRQLVITVVANEVLPRPVSHVVGRDKYESGYRQCSVSWSRLVRVGAVLDEESEW
jgi:hypothetical protein